MDIIITEDDTDGLTVTVNESDGRAASADATAVAAREETNTAPAGEPRAEATKAEAEGRPQGAGLDGGKAPSLLVAEQRAPRTGASLSADDGTPGQGPTTLRERPEEGVFSGGEYGQPRSDRPRERLGAVTESKRRSDENVRSAGAYGGSESRRPSGGGGRSATQSQSKGTVDPGQYTVDELKDELETITDRDRLDATLTHERDEQDRHTAKEAIRRRIRALEEE